MAKRNKDYWQPERNKRYWTVKNDIDYEKRVKRAVCRERLGEEIPTVCQVRQRQQAFLQRNPEIPGQ